MRPDYALGSTIDFKFTSRRFSTGAPHTLAGTPSVAIYADNSTTEITAGVTLSVDFDSRTGLNNVRVVATSGNGFAAGSNYQIVITAGTVDSVSVVGEVVGEFSIEAQSPLRPTTAGRTLDVSAGGEAGIDWANVGSPTTTVGLTGTTIATSQVVASVSGAVASVTNPVTAGTVSDKTGYSLTQSFPANFADLAITSSTGRVTVGTNADKTGYSVTGTINDLDTLYTAIYAARNDFKATGFSTHSAADVRIEMDSNSTQLAAIFAAVDSEIATLLTNLSTANTNISTILGLVDTEITAIKAKTDQLTFTNANKLDASLLAVADLAAAVANKIADHVRRRTQANVEASSDGDSLSLSSQYGMIQQAQESNTDDNPGELTVYRTDGTTELGRRTLATDGTAEPITGVS